MIEELKAVSGGKRLVLVVDKGFYSENNLRTLIKEGYRFLISVPFILSYAKELIEGERGSIDNAENIVKTYSPPIRGVSRKINLQGMELTAHILYNPERELAERNSLYSHTLWLKEQVRGGKSAGFEKDIKKYP